jgi:hypothetical protein
LFSTYRIVASSIRCLGFIPIKQYSSLQIYQNRSRKIRCPTFPTKISPSLDRLHVSIDLRPPRVEVRPSVIAQINPLPPQNEAGDEDLKRVDDTGNPFRRQSGVSKADQLRLYPSALYKAKTRASLAALIKSMIPFILQAFGALPTSRLSCRTCSRNCSAS